MAFLYPEIFIHLDLRLVQGHETAGPMQYVFYIIGQFYQGGIQLFNRYDLLNGSFTQLSVGLYTPINFIIAAGYVLFAPFVQDPAQFFHHWYLIAYYGLGLALRTFGVYLLTYYMTKSRLTALLSTILVNAFCALTLIHLGGLCISSVYNFLPILLFCFVYYWDTRSLKAIIAAALIFLIAANHSLYVGLGYFYQTLHLFLFDMLMIWLIFQRGKKPFLADKFKWSPVVKALLVAVIILLPVFWWGKSLVGDFEAAGSGLGDTKGRFHRILNPVAMLNDDKRSFVPIPEVISHSYDFTKSGWYLSGAFVGITTLILSLIGLILGRHPYKIIFISAAIMIGFLNVPSSVNGGWMMWAHWLDALTNPFCFLVRSFHYSVLLWYLTLAVPLCLGVQACIAIIKKDYKSIYSKRLIVLKVFFASALIASVFIPSVAIKVYAITIFSLFLIFFVVLDYAQLKNPLRLWVVFALCCGIMGVEFFVLKRYINTQSVDMNGAYWDGLRIKPRVFGPMYTPPVPMILDYQNPKILPVRFFYRTDAQVVFPLLVEFQGLFGQFYQYMPLALRLERPDSMYVPRMKIFKGIDQDKQIQEYIKRDGRIMYIADAAILPSREDYDRVLKNGLDRQVIQVEGAHLEKAQKWQDIKLPQALPVNFKQRQYAFNIKEAAIERKQNGVQYQWRLPENFPMYLSTTVFTPDVQLWQLSVGTKQLVLAQGALVTPLTYDVNNVPGWICDRINARGGASRC